MAHCSRGNQGDLIRADVRCEPVTTAGSGSIGGVGRVGGRFSLERLTELKTVVVNLA